MTASLNCVKNDLRLLRGEGGGTNWGSDRKTLLAIYNAHILLRMQYGAQAFCTAPDHILKKLENKALHIISRTNASIHAELGIFPLKYKRKILALKYWFKIKCRVPNSPVLYLPAKKAPNGIPLN